MNSKGPWVQGQVRVTSRHQDPLYGWHLSLAERVGFEPTLEFPLNTLSKRAPSATRPSLRRFREATARQNRSLEPALRFYGDGTPPATCGHYFRKYPELQIQELV